MLRRFLRMFVIGPGLQWAARLPGVSGGLRFWVLDSPYAFILPRARFNPGDLRSRFAPPPPWCQDEATGRTGFWSGHVRWGILFPSCLMLPSAFFADALQSSR